MVSTVINPSGVARAASFRDVRRVSFISSCLAARLAPAGDDMLNETGVQRRQIAQRLDWLGSSAQSEPTRIVAARPESCSIRFSSIRRLGDDSVVGEPLPTACRPTDASSSEGHVCCLADHGQNGIEGRWRLTPDTARRYRRRASSWRSRETANATTWSAISTI